MDSLDLVFNGDLNPVDCLCNGFVLNFGDDEINIVDDFFEFLRCDVEEARNSSGNTFDIPDMAHGSGKLDMPHSLASNLRVRDFDTAFLAGNAAISRLFIFAAVALPVFRRPENSLAEKAVHFRLEGAIINGLRLFNLAAGPSENGVLAGQPDRNDIDIS